MNMADRIERAATLLRQAEATASAVFSTSLGLEDQVVTDLVVRYAPGIALVTLDTGRLPPETYELLARTERHYKRRIEMLFPERESVEQYVRYNGINGFFESVTQRKACCEVRKTLPLKRALEGKRAWVTGLRRAQAITRANLVESCFDYDHQLQKFNPLIDWALADVLAYVEERAVPVNSLHAKGYPSIGCAPCTRAVEAGADVRSGRWWWETADTRECGLHASPCGRQRPTPQAHVA